MDSGTLRLVVADDGIGFDPAHLPAPDGGQHFGLLIMSELEAAGYVAIEKEFLGKKPHTMLRLTDEGQAAFNEYRQSMKQVLDELPDQ